MNAGRQGLRVEIGGLDFHGVVLAQHHHGRADMVALNAGQRQPAFQVFEVKASVLPAGPSGARANHRQCTRRNCDQIPCHDPTLRKCVDLRVFFHPRATGLIRSYSSRLADLTRPSQIYFRAGQRVAWINARVRWNGDRTARDRRWHVTRRATVSTCTIDMLVDVTWGGKLSCSAAKFPAESVTFRVIALTRRLQARP